MFRGGAAGGGGVKTYALVMAGGRGERLWPLSREDRPKPFLPLFGGKTLLEATLDRLAPLVPPERTFLVLREEQEEAARPYAGRARLLLEPLGRDTAGAVLLGLAQALREGAKRLLVLPADHYVGDEEAYREALSLMLEAAEEGYVVTLGLRPTRPETEYGYIRLGPREGGWYRGEGFVEKPSYAKALEYIRRGYVWNGGVFAFTPSTMALLFRRHLPVHHRALERLLAGEPPGAVYGELPKVSLDYGVMEKAERVRVVLGRFPWDDVGNWRALERVFEQDEQENVLLGEGRFVGLDAYGCVVYADRGTLALLYHPSLACAKLGTPVKPFASPPTEPRMRRTLKKRVLGVSGLVVAKVGDEVLVVPKDRAREVRELVRLLEGRGSGPS
jgi:mannose-1-phosphate guanylyltransferase/mannose-6-phosphate isomerase